MPGRPQPFQAIFMCGDSSARTAVLEIRPRHPCLGAGRDHGTIDTGKRCGMLVMRPDVTAAISRCESQDDQFTDVVRKHTMKTQLLTVAT